MPHHPPAALELDELTLRWATLADAELLASAVGASLDHLSPWMPWATAGAADLETQRAKRVEMEKETQQGTSYMYLLLEGDHLHGVLGLHRRIGPGGIEIGYWLRPTSVGKGLVTRAARALTDVALALDDVERVEIHCDEANVRSAAVPERLGYRLDRVEDDGVEAPAEVGRGMVWVYPSSTSAPIS